MITMLQNGRFSRDGNWIYFASESSGQSQIWKMRVAWTALRTHRRQARNRDRLAPERLSPFLDVEGPAWPMWASVGSERRTRSNPCDEPSEPNLGAPRIHGELLKLGIDIGETSVSKYMVRRREPPSQTWRTFLENHVKNLVSVDFFTVPTLRFQVLYVFLVLASPGR